MTEPTRRETQLGLADFKKRLNAAGLNILEQQANFRRNNIYFGIGNARHQTNIVVSEQFLNDLPNTEEYRTMVDSYAHAVAGRLQCGSPDIFYCQSGVAFEISFRWPIEGGVYNNQLKVFLLFNITSKPDGRVAKCSMNVGEGRVFTTVVEAVNSVRSAIDAGQIKFYEPCEHQEFYQAVERRRQPEERCSQPEVERFLAGKAYTLGFTAVDKESDVWAADPWDALYLGVTGRDLALAVRVLRANRWLQASTGSDCVRPTDKLLAEHSSHAREEALLPRHPKLSHNSPPTKEELLKELQRVIGHHPTFALIMLDVDNFKSVNDTNGHPAGDACLDKVIGAVEAVVGQRGRLFRWGGDEFAACLPDFSTAEALTTAERIRSAVEQAKAGGDIEVTTSIGVCGSDRTESRSPEELFKFVDKAMYESKHGRGKNCVTAWPLSSTGNKGENTPSKRLGERERQKLADSVVLSIKTDNGHHRNYTIRIKNHSKEIELAIRRISLWSDGQRISSPVSRPDGANWTVGAEREIPINFDAGEDVAHRLWMLAGSPPKNAHVTPRHLPGHFDAKVRVEITYEVLEIEKTYSEAGSVQVDPTNHVITGL